VKEACDSLAKDLGTVPGGFIAWTVEDEDDANALAAGIEYSARPRCCPNCTPSRSMLLAAGRPNWSVVADETNALFKEVRKFEEYHDQRLSGVPLERMVSDLCWLQNQFTANPASDPQAPRPEGAVEYLASVREQIGLAAWLKQRASPKRGMLAPGLVLPLRPTFGAAKSQTQTP
jgi:hypothetical protein